MVPNGIVAASSRGELVVAEAGPGPGSTAGSSAGSGYQAMVDDVRRTLPEDTLRVMSPEFYLSFWSLNYQDIFVPSARWGDYASGGSAQSCSTVIVLLSHGAAAAAMAAAVLKVTACQCGRIGRLASNIVHNYC